MTPTEVGHAQKIARGLWPHLAGKRGWSPEQWSVFCEQAERIDVTGHQAELALRNLLATFDGYPKPSILIKAIKRAEAPAARTAQAVEAQTVAPLSRLRKMREQLGFDPTVPDGEVVRYWYAEAAHRSNRLRGYVRESLWAHMHTDLIELGHYDPTSADEAILSAAANFRSDPPAEVELTPQQRWHTELARRNPKFDPDQYERRWAREHNARPQIDKAQRQTVCDELQSLTVSEIQDLAGEKTGARS